MNPLLMPIIMNKIYIIISIALGFHIVLFSQDKSKMTYIEVIESGVSTGPAFAVVIIHNLNNNIKREIMVVVQ